LQQAILSDLWRLPAAVQTEVARDEVKKMTDRSRLPESEAQLRLLFGQVPAVIWTTDRDLKYTLAEGAGLAALKIGPGELIGKPVASTGTAGSPEADTMIQAHRRALAGESVAYRTQWAGLFIEGYIEPLRGADGEIDGCIGVALDTSERMGAYQTLEQRVNERTRELSSLLEFSRQASATLDVRLLMELVVEEVTRLVEATEVGLFLLDGTVLVVRAQRGLSQDGAAGELQLALEDSDLAALRRSSSSAIVISDLAGSQEVGLIGSAGRRWLEQRGELRSIMWVPLTGKQTVMGGLGIAHAKPNKYGEHEAGLVEAIACQAAIAIENACLYKQAQELAVLQERQRLARELHDSVTQSLYSLTLMAEAARRLVTAGSVERGTGYLARIGESAQQLLKEMRLLVYELRPLTLERDGLASALKQRLEAVEGRAGVETSLIIEGSGLVPEHIDAELYRIAQEALNNSLKHSGASSVMVRLCTTPKEVALTVSDNGRGFLAQSVADKGGLGLVSMQERTHRLGGRLDIVSQPDEGALIAVCIPFGVTGKE
jgi:signal transduction histidine kinase